MGRFKAIYISKTEFDALMELKKKGNLCPSARQPIIPEGDSISCFCHEYPENKGNCRYSLNPGYKHCPYRPNQNQ